MQWKGTQVGINYRQCKNIVSFGVHLNESYTSIKPRNWNGKCGISYFCAKFNKPHLVNVNIIIYFCFCQNTLSYIFENVLQITHFCIGVQKYDLLCLLVSLICLPEKPVCRSLEFRQTRLFVKLILFTFAFNKIHF